MTSTLFASDSCDAVAGTSVPVEAGVVTLRRLAPSTLTEARLTAGLTLGELARRVHVSRPAVAGWEKRSRRPGRHFFGALAAALNLSGNEVEALFHAYPAARLDGRPLPSLASLRRRSGLTQRAVAQLVGVAPTTLSMWETAGIAVAPAMAARLAQILGADVAQLAATPALVLVPDPRPLRRWRREAGMSQREAAAHLGIAVGSLARYEAQQRRPPVDVARRMAGAYRRSLEDILAACRIRLLPLPTGVRWRLAEVPDGIRAARTVAGLTRVGLGRAVGRSGQAVRGWEMGRSLPSDAVRRRLEAVLGLPAGKLPSGTGRASQARVTRSAGHGPPAARSARSHAALG